MLRRTMQSVAMRHAMRRNYAAATSAMKKRALAQSQLQGQSKPKPTPTDKAGAPPPAVPPSESSTMIPVAVAGLLLLGGTAYYLDLIPGLQSESKEVPVAKETAQATEATTVSEEAPNKEEKVGDTVIEEVMTVSEEALKKEEEVGEAVIEEATTVSEEAVKEVIEEVEEKVIEEVTSIDNHVLAAQAPSTERPSATVSPPDEHPPQGNLVGMKPLPSSEASVEEAVKELVKGLEEEASATLAKAHKSIRASFNESLFSDLDQRSAAELRVRVVQLATEMEERTKWEAVRLKEFLAMKEKETADKYMEILQKQRLEFESLLASKLREQEDVLSRQASAALQQKDSSIQAVVQAAAEAQDVEHKADLESTAERLKSELNAKYEIEYAEKIAEIKSAHVRELEEKLSMINDLANQLQHLESALKESRSFETGSLRAHRMSAAALAFAEKLETSKGAMTELEALKAAAADNDVIVSAVSIVPASVVSGIPTLSELQTRFDTVYKKSRQAGLVPAGRVGLGGQLMGIVFSTLKYAPDPDTPAPEDSKDSTEYLLVRARRHVQLGELERAIEQLEKLEGQAAFTVKDWTQHAKDRVAAEKAARVIKMECAILNESMSSGASSK